MEIDSTSSQKAGIWMIELKGITEEESFRINKILQLLIVAGGLGIKDGKTIMHWKNNYLKDIELRSHPYLADREI